MLDRYSHCGPCTGILTAELIKTEQWLHSNYFSGPQEI